MTHLEELQLEELALGTIAAGERRAALDHVGGCARCSAALRALREAWATIGLEADEVPPSPGLRDRLRASIDAPGLLGFADLVARTFDLPREEASVLLQAADDRAPWQPGPAPGLELKPFRPGPRLAAAEAGLLRGGPGSVFPRHAHLGRELVVVLRGGLVTDAGAERWPGATLVSEPGSSHSFEAGPAGCLAAVLVFEGIDLEGRGAMRVRGERRTT